MSDASGAYPVGRTLGGFTVESIRGEGGMGVVYLARQEALERPAVLKQLHKELARDEDQVERFRREARAAAAIHHQNVVAVYDGFVHRGTHYLASEYVDGADLVAVLTRLRKAKLNLPIELACYIMSEALKGLDFAHRAVGQDGQPLNIIHRDVNLSLIHI